MGIGLTLVKRLVEIHGGSVDATSRGIGHGSEFVVRLPLASALATVVPARGGGAGASSAHVEAGLRAVIVDDNEDVRELGRELLEQLGCTVETAADGVEGLDRILQTRPDLALVDIGLPGLNGFDVA